ncbi:MAG TPA: hypothetical protein VGG92_21865 [Caulobacteraceae bacterium]|jgi:hypothetical protein
MFSDREIAAQTIERVKGILGDLDQLLVVIEPTVADEEYRNCKNAVGHVMAEVFERLAEPIAAAHPELRYWA